MSGLSDSVAAMGFRERFLLASLIAVVVPVALYQLVAAPLLVARDRAVVSEAQARAMLDWVIERDAAWPVDAETSADAPEALRTSAPVGLSGIENALSDADLRDNVQALQNEADGRISMRLSHVQFADLGRYLEEVDQRLGYEITTLRIRQTDVSGLVDVELLIDAEAQ